MTRTYTYKDPAGMTGRELLRIDCDMKGCKASVHPGSPHEDASGWRQCGTGDPKYKGLLLDLCPDCAAIVSKMECSGFPLEANDRFPPGHFHPGNHPLNCQPLKTLEMKCQGCGNMVRFPVRDNIWSLDADYLSLPVRAGCPFCGNPLQPRGHFELDLTLIDTTWPNVKAQ